MKFLISIVMDDMYFVGGHPEFTDGEGVFHESVGPEILFEEMRAEFKPNTLVRAHAHLTDIDNGNKIEMVSSVMDHSCYGNAVEEVMLMAGKSMCKYIEDHE